MQLGYEEASPCSIKALKNGEFEFANTDENDYMVVFDAKEEAEQVMTNAVKNKTDSSPTVYAGLSVVPAMNYSAEVFYGLTAKW